MPPIQMTFSQAQDLNPKQVHVSHWGKTLSQVPVIQYDPFVCPSTQPPPSDCGLLAEIFLLTLCLVRVKTWNRGTAAIRKVNGQQLRLHFWKGLSPQRRSGGQGQDSSVLRGETAPRGRGKI